MNQQRFPKVYNILFVLFLSVALLAGCAGTSTAPDQPIPDKIYKLTILHTNDHHGRFWQNRHGEYGMAARKTLVDAIRQEVADAGGNVLLLDAGDINTGIPESDLLDAEPDIRAMNLMKYDAMAAGNHEFDNSPEVLEKQKNWMEFPLLSANVYNRETGKSMFPATANFNFDGLRVTVLGLTTGDTYKQGNPDYVNHYIFKSPIETADAMVPGLKKNADIIIALAHLGYYVDGAHGGNAPGSVSLARTVDNIDVIIDGHTHEKLDTPVREKEALILQAEEYGKYLGRLDLEYFNGTLTATGYRLIPVNLKKKVTENGETKRVLIEDEIAQDPATAEALSAYLDSGKELLGKVVGSSDGEFVGERKIVRNNETNLGNLACQANMAKTGADLAVMNSGGIRDSLPAGEITYKDVLKTKPFGNNICTVDITGKEVRAYLEAAVSKEKDTGAFAQFSGVRITVEGERITALEIGGEPLNYDKTYRLVLESYIASGGDGYPKVSDHKGFVDTGFVDADVLKDYIAENSPLKTADYAPTEDVLRK